MSTQRELLWDLWVAHEDEITKNMLRDADRFLAKGHPVDPNDPRPADPKWYHGLDEGCIFWDGCFEPFYLDNDLAELWQEYDAKNGNENDESDLIGLLWIHVLVKADAEKYKYMILTFVDILIRGL